jgi:hypothetical protein
MADHLASLRAPKRRKPVLSSAIRSPQSPFRSLRCPVCSKPFERDPEVGPVPTCECGERGKEDPEGCPLFPTDNERMMNAKWSAPDDGRP